MCTVSFFRDDEHVIITSNRDEHINRPHALPPSRIVLKDHTVFCPIDPQHQGTWFAVNHLGNTFVLFNGAEHKHTPQPPYKKSRGLILLEIADSTHCIDHWRSIELNKIEPFTLVAFYNKNLFQLRWDGHAKSEIELDIHIPHIWSSATLYSHETINNRKDWFSEFINHRNASPDANDLLQFHMTTHSGDAKNGLIINRENTMVTKNVTQCILEKSKFTIHHHDLILNNQSSLSEFIDEK